MVESYRQFASLGSVHSFEVEGISFYAIDEVNAVCLFSFGVDYSVNEERFIEKGMETYIVADYAAFPRIMWRSQENFSRKQLG